MSAQAKQSAPSTRSTRDRGQIIPKGQDKWLVRVFAGRNPLTGKRKYSSETVTGTRKDAERARTRLLAAADAGELPTTSKAPTGGTLEAFLTEWLDTVAKQSRSARTHADYTKSLTYYVIPEIGGLPLKEVTTRVIQGLYSGMTERGLSPNTVRLVHAPLRQALQTAVSWELITENPAVGTVRPKLRRQERQTLSVDQVNSFLETYAEDGLYALWCLFLLAGLRPGEALALKWSDLQGNRLTVQRALTEVETRKWEVGPTKTEDSVGTITLPQVAVVALRRHKRTSDWIFADPQGNFLRPDTVAQRWGRMLKRAGLPAMRLYDTRHTHATLLLGAGVNPKIVSSRLRHASVSITLDTYSHVLREIESGVADTLDDLLVQGRKKAPRIAKVA